MNVRHKVIDSIMQQVKDSILSDSSVIFIQENESDETLLGSGTLVSIGDTTAILTADHVLEKLPQPPEPVRIFFPTRFAESPRSESPRSNPRPSKTIEYFAKKTIGRGTHEAEGPDLGLLIVHKSVIPSTSTFYNLTKRGSDVLRDPRPYDDGVWVLVGAPAEWTRPAERDASFATVKQQPILMGFTDVRKEFEKDDFDYLDVAVNSDSGYGAPADFGGCSGGGLWHIDANKTASGEILMKGPILSGVAFYEYYEGVLRCHGRQSIYRRVIQALQS